ncbi:hypothetical protein [Streptomyces sp. Wb2n-11]|uniref:hypothetical protein n=1 Tax=Streptomyces sp. Wb2n-11 TaxID=1030533 RepID=UPI000A62E5AE|nr:hypothetical protein [Streptomyces sp. Wb2n-11]
MTRRRQGQHRASKPYLVGRARQEPCSAQRTGDITLCRSGPVTEAPARGVPPGRGLRLAVVALAGTRGAGQRDPGKVMGCGFTLP